MRKGSLVGSIIEEDEENDTEETTLAEEEEDEEQEGNKGGSGMGLSRAEQEFDSSDIMIRKATLEWDNVEATQSTAKQQRGGKNDDVRGGLISEAASHVTSTKLLTHLRSALESSKRNHSRPSIVPYEPVNRGIWRMAMSLLSTNTLTVPGLEGEPSRIERDAVFHFANVPYNPDDEVHFGALRAVYEKLTRRRQSEALKVGEFWKDIGFQGCNPCTDLNRSGGVLTVHLTLNLLDLCRTGSKLEGFVRKIFEWSTESEGKGKGAATGWPFMCVAINFTVLAMQALRRGDVYGVIAREYEGREGVLNCMRDALGGFFLRFFETCAGDREQHHAVGLNFVRKRATEKGYGKEAIYSFRRIVG